MREPLLPTLEGLPGVFEETDLLQSGPERLVVRLRNLETGCIEVLKAVRPDAGEPARAAVAAEFLLLDRIRHPHLVRAHHFVHLADGSCGYLMEDLPGGPPRDAGTPGWAPGDLEAARAVLGALSTLHAIGVAHLDLKPSQVLFGPRGHCLIDLGLAASPGDPIAARGTWGFIAPEILSGKAWDARADLYGLGCLLVQVWTGASPAGEGEIADQLRRQWERPRLRLRDRMPDIAEGLDRVVEGLLDPDPERRPKDAFRAWESLHTMCGSRERYLERRRLPLPDGIPFVAPAGIEEEWDASVREGDPRHWAVEGPIGSGRHRLLERMRSSAEVLGATGRIEEDGALRVVGAGNEIRVRIGRARAGEKVLALGAAGEAQARAALAAYCLAPEGGEADWTRGLLELRLQEREGGEEARRRSGRSRRALAAAEGARLTESQRATLADILANSSEGEAPSIRRAPALVRDGWLRANGQGRIAAAVPPWDLTALRVAAGAEAMRAAHRKALARDLQDPAIALRHAVAAEDREAALSIAPAAVYELRARRDLSRVFTVLSETRDLLGSAYPPALLAREIPLALEYGAPHWCLPLSRIGSPVPPPEWRLLLRAHLDRLGGRAPQAIESVTPLLHAGDPGLRRAARLITVQAHLALGDHDGVLASGVEALRAPAEGESPSERLGIAYPVFEVLTIRGVKDGDYVLARSICEQCLAGAGPFERMVAGAALGMESLHKGDFAEAGRIYGIALDAAEALGDPIQIAVAQANLAGVLCEGGRLAEGEALLRRSIDTYEASGEPARAAFTRRNLAAALADQGRLGESIDACRAARSEAEAIGAVDFTDIAVQLEAHLLSKAGLLDPAETLMSEALDRFAARPQPNGEAIVLREKGSLERSRGRIEDARRAWARSVEVARAGEIADEEARTLITWAAAESVAGNREAAVDLVRRAEKAFRVPEAGEIAVLSAMAQAMLVDCAQGDEEIDRAHGVLAGAAAVAIRSGLRLWIWRCHAAMAGLSMRRGEGGRALAEIGAAREALRDLLLAIGVEALQESYILSPDVRVFLAWCDRDPSPRAAMAQGASDLEVFLQ